MTSSKADSVARTPGQWMAVIDKPNARNRMALVSTGTGSAIDCTGSGETYAESCANAQFIADATTMESKLRALRMQYIGACSLLARVAGHELDDESRDLIRQCLDDCAAITETLEVVRVTGRLGYSLEPKSNPARKFRGVGHLESTGYIPAGSASEREGAK